jgi:hypothetical protein
MGTDGCGKKPIAKEAKYSATTSGVGGRSHASPMRKADGRHNVRLSTSWRDVISHSPRGIPCFDGSAHPAHNS